MKRGLDMYKEFTSFRNDISAVLNAYFQDIFIYNLEHCDSPEMFISQVSRAIEFEEKNTDIEHDCGKITDAQYELVRDCILILRVNLSLLTYEFQRGALNILPKDMWDMYTNIFER